MRSSTTRPSLKCFSRRLPVLAGALLATVSASSIAGPLSVPGAENVLQVGQSLYISGNTGLYLSQQGTDGQWGPAVRLPVALSSTGLALTSNQCYFTGLALRGTDLYALCTPKLESALSPRYLMRVDLSAPLKQARPLMQLNNWPVLNGLTIDAAGHLYAANWGQLLGYSMGGIVKFTMNSPTSVASATHWYRSMNRVNGMRTDGSTIYFTENPQLYGNSSLRKVSIKADGTAGTPSTLYATSCYLDDIGLEQSGVLLAAQGKGCESVLWFNEATRSMSSLPAPTQPSSVRLVQGSNQLWITSIKNNTVDSYATPWSLQARP